MTGQAFSSGQSPRALSALRIPSVMQSETGTLVPLKAAVDAALDDLKLAEDIRAAAGELSWRGVALALGLSLDAVRMLGADPSRCQRGTKALARQGLAKLASLKEGS